MWAADHVSDQAAVETSGRCILVWPLSQTWESRCWFDNGWFSSALWDFHPLTPRLLCVDCLEFRCLAWAQSVCFFSGINWQGGALSVGPADVFTSLQEMYAILYFLFCKIQRCGQMQIHQVYQVWAGWTGQFVQWRKPACFRYKGELYCI